MIIVLIFLSILSVILVGIIYKQFKNSPINPELSEVFKNKQKELSEMQFNFAKLQGEFDSLKNKCEEKENKILDLEKAIQIRDERLINISKSAEKANLLEGQVNEKNKNIENLKNLNDEQNKEIIDLKSQNSFLNNENKNLKKQLDEKDSNINELKKLTEDQNKQIIIFKGQNSFLEGENQKLKEENHIKRELEERLKEVEIENKKNFVELEEKKKNIENLMQLQEQIKNQFKVISTEIIKEQKENFSKEQNESLGNLLIPLNRDIKEFKDKIQQVQDGNNANTIKIEENIKNLLTTTKDIGNKADNLATALKGDKKAQGNWGECQLQNLLEMSGLEQGISFFKQYNIKNSSGKDFFLDFLIKLPEDRILIVDSKVSMVNYQKYISCNNENDKNICLKAYCEDIKNHIKELGAKEYQNVYKEYNKKTNNDTPDFVFMFVAVEGAYIDAIKYDKSIFEVASRNNVVIVTTSSFMPVLRMIEHLWNIENQNKYISDIVDLSKKLYAKMEKFSKDIATIGESLDKAKDAYISAKNYISTGKGNMMSISDKIIAIADKGKVRDKIAIDFEVDEE